MSEEMFTGTMPDSMVDAMFSDDAATPAADVSTEVEVPEVADDQPAEAEVVEPVDDAPAVDAPDAPEAPADQAAAPADAEIPEGVTVRERGGKKEWVYPEDRGRSIYEGYKIAKQAEEVLGEPVTPEALADRQQAHEWLQNQRIDAISPDPRDQANVFRNIFREAAEAIQNGEIGHDPLETIGESFMDTLRTVAPEHYEQTANAVMLSRVQSLYSEAAKPGNEKLLRSLQNIEHHLTGKYTPDDKVMQQKVDPVASREESLNRREQAIQNHARQQQQQALRLWHEGTKTSIVESVRSVLTEQIPDAVKSAFKALPNGEQRISNTIKLLDIEVQSAIKSDQNWRTQNANLFKQAEMAPSEERRAAIKAQIIQRYQQKTRQVMTAKAKSIIDAESLVLQKANAATKERMRAGAENKSTPGASQPAPRRIPTDAASSGSWADWIESAI